MNTLRYLSPATQWNEALPIGNGSLGAMCTSGTTQDKLWINEDTLWSGNPHSVLSRDDLSAEGLKTIRQCLSGRDYIGANKASVEWMRGYANQTYVPAGEVNIDLCGEQYPSTDYERTLHLDTAILESHFSIGQSTISKEIFASYPDHVIVYRIRCSTPKKFRISACADLCHTVAANLESCSLTLLGECPDRVSNGSAIYDDPQKEHISYELGVLALPDSHAHVMDWGTSLFIENVSEMTVLICVVSSFNGYKKMPRSEGQDYLHICATHLENARKKDFHTLRDRHTQDYRALYSRVKLRIGEDDDDLTTLPTDVLIRDHPDAPCMAELLFNYGRYLLISSSRPGSQPANLQGIWNDMVSPPWNSNYTLNINTEMNYWPAGVCALPECEEPLITMIRELAAEGNDLGLPGWAVWHNTDIWRFHHEATKWPQCGLFPLAGLWLCRHIKEHYAFTGDKEFLRKNIPVLDGACAFTRAWLVKTSKGTWTTSPSTSPENCFQYQDQTVAVATGSAIDLTLCRDIFTITADCREALGMDIGNYRAFAARIHPLTISADGRLLEYNEPFVQSEPGHRHLSHLYCVYPGDFAAKNPVLLRAARRSLDDRVSHGGGHTGWSNAWLACLYARMGDGEGVAERVETMLRRSVYPNLLDAHPPFQIDGNLGICAAIAEALVQSHGDKVQPLPALPHAWRSGEVRGLRVRGGKSVNFCWKNGQVFFFEFAEKE